MLTYFFTTKFYNLIKSGFLMDYFFKKLILNFINFLFLVYNIVLSEKYFVEYFFLQLKITTNYLKNIIDLFFNEFTINVLATPIFVIFLVFLLCYSRLAYI